VVGALEGGETLRNRVRILANSDKSKTA